MTNVIFKKFEVIGKTKDEAIENAAPMNLMVNATQQYKKWAKEHTTDEASVKQWMKDYLKSKNYDKPGIGAYIVTQTGVQDTRERPYKELKPKYEARTHTPVKFYVGRDRATGTELFREKTSKAAVAAAKEWVCANQASVEITTEWKAKENNALYTTIEYTPTKGSQPYKILCFGYQLAD